MSTKTLAAAELRVAALTARRDALEAELRAARADALAMMLRDTETRWQVLGPLSMEPVANVSLIVPKTTVTMTAHPDKLLAWVKVNHPGEVVEAVREPFRRALMAKLVVKGKGAVNEHGDRMSWATVTMRPAGDPTEFRLTFTENGRAELLDAWLAGEFDDLDPTVTP